MENVKLVVDVYCKDKLDTSPVYRVYVDNDLLTERTWIWPEYEIFIKENIEVNLEPGNHTVTIENCGASKCISARAITVNGTSRTVPSTEFQTVTFTV
jgi:hypothetical protein